MATVFFLASFGSGLCHTAMSRPQTRIWVGFRPVREEADAKGIHAPNCGISGALVGDAVSMEVAVSNSRISFLNNGEDAAVTGVLGLTCDGTNELIWSKGDNNSTATKCKIVIAMIHALR